MKTTLIYILCVLFNFLLFSCDRNKQQETVCSSANTVLVPQDLKDRFFFKVGTYWIYQNLETSEIDSIWVSASSTRSISVDDDDYGFIKNKCYESFGTRRRNKMFEDSAYYNTYSIHIYPQEGTSKPELFGLMDSYGLMLSDAIFRINAKGGKYDNQMGAQIEYSDSLETMKKDVFKDILRIYYDVNVSTYDYLTDMYYAKNIGLVKFKMRQDNSEWELIRWNILQ